MPAWFGWAAVVLLSLYLALFPALASASRGGYRTSTGSGCFPVRCGVDVVRVAASHSPDRLCMDRCGRLAWSAWIAQGARWIGHVWPVRSGGTRRRSALAWNAAADGAPPRPDSRADGRCNYPRRSMAGGPEPRAQVHCLPHRAAGIGQDEKNDQQQADRNARRYARLSGTPTAGPDCYSGRRSNTTFSRY